MEKEKEVENKKEEEERMDHWDSKERESSKSKYGCEILVSNGSYTEVCGKKFPNDAYIVKYMVKDKICFDLTRGAKIQIFDMYWDKFNKDLKSIEYGQGLANPKLWDYKTPKTKKRK